MANNLSVFIADIDGTLTVKGGPLGPVTRSSLQRLHEEGVLIGIASGRPVDHRMYEHSRDWNLGFGFDFMIGMNGGDLWDKEEGSVIHYHKLSREVMREILEFISSLGLNAIIYENAYDRVLALQMDNFLESSSRRNHSIVEIGDINRLCRFDTGKIEVHYNPLHTDNVMPLILNRVSEKWAVVQTFPGTIEFQDPMVSKGNALKKYCARHDLSLSQVIAFGDMDNDIPMLQAAGWGVCLLNGSESTKKAANAVTEFGVTDDGVGKYLERHWPGLGGPINSHLYP